MLEEIKISLLIEFSAAVLSRGLQAASTGCFLSYHDGFHFSYYFKKEKKKKKKGGRQGKKRATYNYQRCHTLYGIAEYVG